MDSFSIANLALRGLLISVFVYMFISMLPATSNLQAKHKFLVIALVLVLYAIIEYIVILYEVPGFCNIACGTPNTAEEIDRYVNNAMLNLRIAEQAGPAVQPQLLQQIPQVPVQIQAQPQMQPQLIQVQPPQVQMQPQMIPVQPQQVQMQPQMPVVIAPAVQPQVVPSAVPTAAPVTPPVPLMPESQPQVSLTPPVATSVRTGGGQYF